MEKTSDPVKTAKRLHILWWITYLAVSAVFGFRKYSIIARTGSDVWSPFSDGFQLFLLVSTVAWFLPLMAAVRRYAKAGKMRKTVWFSTFMIVLLACWTLVGIFFPQLMQ